MSKPFTSSENLAYHAARLLILIGHCGKPQSNPEKLPAIMGRTLLAKLDFFMRYPYYLKLAIEKLGGTYKVDDLGISIIEDIHTVESRMIRYLYGPWDNVYYLTIAYMVGKGLVEPPLAKNKVDEFRLTSKGLSILNQFQTDPVFSDLIKRAETIYKFFNAYNGSRLKLFIYSNFPEVIDRRIGEKI